MRHAPAAVLLGIVLLNIIAIMLLHNNAQREPVQDTAPRAPIVVMPQKPQVRAIVLSPPDCPDCYDIRQYLTELDERVNLTVEDGPAAPFNPPRLPAIAFSADLEEYPQLIEGWGDIGVVRNLTGAYAGVWYVLPTLNPPYVQDGVIRGRVTATYLTKKDCADCYDVTTLADMLTQVRIAPWKEVTYDVASPEGAALVERYNITRVPTLLLDKETGAYSWMPLAWSSVGTVEDDGTFVLRDLQRMQVVHYDAVYDKVMRP